MGLFGAAHDGQLSHISYIDETWHTSWVLLTSGFFHRKLAIFKISGNTGRASILMHKFWIFYFFESSKVVLVSMVKFLMMSAKLATLGLLKINVFWNKGYDVITFVCDVTNKILSRDLNHIVDVVMRPKFVNSRIPMRQVIITSIL